MLDCCNDNLYDPMSGEVCCGGQVLFDFEHSGCCNNEIYDKSTHDCCNNTERGRVSLFEGEFAKTSESPTLLSVR